MSIPEHTPDRGDPRGRLLADREVPRFPYIPADPEKRDQRCYDVYNIQVHGLAKRIRSSGIENVVIGVSGGLDSAHALIVAARTMDLLERPRSHIYAYTMPGFATMGKTYRNALRLMNSLKVEVNELDIRPSCMGMFKDIGHPFAEGQAAYDTTFENVQAGERTSHLFRIANYRNALVLGTGDLSELALGWCTYGVGDHMSHYAINASVPKTLIQHLMRWVAQSGIFPEETAHILLDVLDTEISPELIPGDGGDQPAQKSESVIGPFELQDFNNFYITRFGYLPSKVAFLAYLAWRDKNGGTGRTFPRTGVTPTPSGKYGNGSRFTFTVFSKRASSSGPASPTPRRSGRGDPSRPGGLPGPERQRGHGLA